MRGKGSGKASEIHGWPVGGGAVDEGAYLGGGVASKMGWRVRWTGRGMGWTAGRWADRSDGRRIDMWAGR